MNYWCPRLKDVCCTRCGEQLKYLAGVGEPIGCEDGYGLFDISCDGHIHLMCSKCKRYYLFCNQCDERPDDFDLFLEDGDGKHCEFEWGGQLMKFLGYSSTEIYRESGYEHISFRPNKSKDDPILYDPEGGRKVHYPASMGSKSFYETAQENGQTIEFVHEQAIQDNQDETVNLNTFICHYLGDRNYHYMDDAWNSAPTGPDGGFPVYWKCEKCDIIHEMSDK